MTLNPEPLGLARQARTPAAAVQGLPALQPVAPYRYVLLHLWVITVTRRSVNLAVASAALTFTALQARAGGGRRTPPPPPSAP